MKLPGNSSEGNSVRLNRVWRNVSSKELAEKAGISPAYLSRIECGKANPSLNVLKRLADALGVSVDAVLHGEAQAREQQEVVGRPRERPAVVRRDTRKKMTPAGSSVTYELLSPDLQGALQFILVRHEPEETTQYFSHRGEESIFCLEGTLGLTIGNEEFVLEEGDCITFNCSETHSVRAMGGRPATLIAAQVPPSF